MNYTRTISLRSLPIISGTYRIMYVNKIRTLHMKFRLYQNWLDSIKNHLDHYYFCIPAFEYIKIISSLDFYSLYMLVRDIIYGDYYLSRTAWYLSRHPAMQRLKDVKQCGVLHWTYEYRHATHTRYEHSLGTWFITTTLLRRLQLPNKIIEICGAAALFHDIAHGCFSHAFDNTIIPTLFPGLKDWPRHEQRARALLIHLGFRGDTWLNLIGLIEGRDSPLTRQYPFLHHLLNNPSDIGLDVDRIDHLTRDSFYLFGDKLDWKCLVQSAKITQDRQHIIFDSYLTKCWIRRRKWLRTQVFAKQKLQDITFAKQIRTEGLIETLYYPWKLWSDTEALAINHTNILSFTIPKTKQNVRRH